MKSKKRTSYPQLLSIPVLLVCLLTLLLARTALGQAGISDNPLLAAWRQAETAGSYRFTADIAQTLIPRPLPGMIGQRDQHFDIAAAGDVVGHNHSRLTLQTGGANAEIMTLIRDGDQVLIQQGEAQTLVESTPGQVDGTALTTGGYLEYLIAADHVEALPAEQLGDETLARYGFVVDGPRFADYMLSLVEAQGTLPMGVTLQPSPAYQTMTGRGELWVDADGFPRRQLLELELPEANAEYVIRVRVVVVFRDFGQVETVSQIVPESAPFEDGASSSSDATAWRIEQRPAPPAVGGRLRFSLSDLAMAAPAAAILVLVIALLGLLWRYRQTPRVYAAFAAGMALVLVGAPLLQTLGVSHFMAQQAAAAALPAESRAPVSNPASALAEVAAATQTWAEVVAKCGDGAGGLDVDGDGLSDAAENCLGTSPYDRDSDGDGISDLVEITPLEFGGRTWYGDPLQPDTNRDGLSDGTEYPVSHGGTAASWDPDGDGTPNPWDPDNDNDGVADADDLSPFNTLGLRDSFDLNLWFSNTSDYVYLTFQVRPSNPDHLRYGVMQLVWPYDEAGTIRNLRTEQKQNVTLQPMLEVLAKRLPSEADAAYYNITHTPNTDRNTAHYPYILLIPLSPVGSQGQTTAFQGVIAYRGTAVNQDVYWTRARIVWVVQAPYDTVAADGTVTRRFTPVAKYVESQLQVTGLEVMRSVGLEYAVLGTPNDLDNDQALFQTLFGMSATFLHSERLEGQPSEQTALQYVAGQFNSDANLWGITTTVRATQQVVVGDRNANLDAIGATAVPAFLNAPGYSPGYGPAGRGSLILAVEEKMGVIDLLAVNNASLGGNVYRNYSIGVWPGEMELITQRSLFLKHYQLQFGEWQAETTEATLTRIRDRYGNFSGSLSQLQSDYPALTDADLLGVVLTLYAQWATGQTVTAAYHPHTPDPLNPGGYVLPRTVAASDVTARFGSATLDLPAYLINVSQLATAGGGLDFEMSAVWQKWRGEEVTLPEIGLTPGSMMMAGYIGKAGVMSGVSVAMGLHKAYTAMSVASTAPATAPSALRILCQRGLDTFKKVGAVVGAVTTTMEVWGAWSTTFTLDDPVAMAQAANYALATTIVLVTLFARVQRERDILNRRLFSRPVLEGQVLDGEGRKFTGLGHNIVYSNHRVNNAGPSSVIHKRFNTSRPKITSSPISSPTT